MSNTTQAKPASTKCVIGPDTLFSYAHVFAPHASLQGQEPKYSVQLRIPKTNLAAIAKINASIQAAIEAGKSTWGGKIPTGLKTPLRDGDVERPDDPSYANHYFINASNKTKPGLVDNAMNEIIDPSDFYSGCIGNVSVNFFAYNVSGAKGIGCGLNNIQKLKDGTPLSGRARPEADFTAVDEEFLA